MNALRAFEAAARLGGFTTAANELCVTPGAIAQHVKTLEAWAGARLFERHGKGVKLTGLGVSVAGEFSMAFDHLGSAVQSLRASASPHHIRIAALPSVAQLWLSPKLPEIRAMARDVTISITAMETAPNLQREPYDLSIFFQADVAGATALAVSRDTIFPVCIPRLAARLSAPSDLGDLTCLQDASWSQDWSLWLQKASPDIEVDVRGPTFSLYSLAVEEALNGAGVLMAHELLVRAHLGSGALVAPFSTKIDLERTLTINLARAATAGSPLALIVESLAQGQNCCLPYGKEDR